LGNTWCSGGGGDGVEGARAPALCSALRARKITVAELARPFGVDDRKAARLIDPRAAGRRSALEEALSALGYAVAIEVHKKPRRDRASAYSAKPRFSFQPGAASSAFGL